MSLTSVLSTATSALLSTQFQISTVSDNIANASTPGATQKTYTSTSSASLTSALSTGEVTRLTDNYLSQTVNTAASTDGASSVVNSYLTSYDDSLGSVANSDDISSLLTNFQTALTTLSDSPSTAADKTQVVSAATTLAGSISNLSASIQSLRNQASTDIGSTVASINTDLTSLQSLNSQIASGMASDSDVTGLEDQRDTTLTNLSSMIGVQYYTTANNQLVVYDSGGDQLLGAKASTLSYDQSSALSASSTYSSNAADSGIAGVELNGKDITNQITTGSLGGLIQLRDDTLPAQQDALDQVASNLISTVNTAAGSTIFTGTDASTIAVSASLTANPSTLQTSTLGAAGTVGTDGTTVAASDVSAITAIEAALKATQTLAQVGSAPASTTTVAASASTFMSNAASLISAASTAATDNDTAYSTATNALSNATGISTDQQTALLTQYQNQYESASELITAVKDMFSTLLTAMQAS
jgi:flagellar hook-associated protein 1 FlgK